MQSSELGTMESTLTSNFLIPSPWPSRACVNDNKKTNYHVNKFWRGNDSSRRMSLEVIDRLGLGQATAISTKAHHPKLVEALYGTV